MKRQDIRLFASDLDGTLLGDPSAVERFAAAWAELAVGARPLLVYNTGRSVKDTLAVAAARGLPDPDYVIGSLGTELYDSLYRLEVEFRAQFGLGWNIDIVDEIVRTFPNARRQAHEFLHGFKSSWYWPRAHGADIEEVRRRLAEARIRAKVVYSCRYFLDVIPTCAGKGAALSWLCHRLNIPTSRAVVAGDTGNDTEMFLLPEVHGIIVANGLPELLGSVLRKDVYMAPSEMAEGVIEGLRAVGVFRSATDACDSTPAQTPR